MKTKQITWLTGQSGHPSSEMVYDGFSQEEKVINFVDVVAAN
jgi:hypothetical protein